MQRIGWILFVLTGAFALVGAAPFGAGVFLAVLTFLLALIPTWHGAITSGALTLLCLVLALSVTPVEVMKLKSEAGYLFWLGVILLAFSWCFSHGLAVQRSRKTGSTC